MAAICKLEQHCKKVDGDYFFTENSKLLFKDVNPIDTNTVLGSTDEKVFKFQIISKNSDKLATQPDN